MKIEQCITDTVRMFFDRFEQDVKLKHVSWPDGKYIFLKNDMVFIHDYMACDRRYPTHESDFIEIVRSNIIDWHYVESYNTYESLFIRTGFVALGV